MGVTNSLISSGEASNEGRSETNLFTGIGREIVRKIL
jgi:hypothetical protein